MAMTLGRNAGFFSCATCACKHSCPGQSTWTMGVGWQRLRQHRHIGGVRKCHMARRDRQADRQAIPIENGAVPGAWPTTRMNRHRIPHFFFTSAKLMGVNLQQSMNRISCGVRWSASQSPQPDTAPQKAVETAISHSIAVGTGHTAVLGCGMKNPVYRATVPNPAFPGQLAATTARSPAIRTRTGRSVPLKPCRQLQK